MYIIRPDRMSSVKRLLLDIAKLILQLVVVISVKYPYVIAPLIGAVIK